MRILRNKKGQMRIIEAFFASILLLSVLTLIPPHVSLTGKYDQTLISAGRNALLTLDSQGYLSQMIENGTWSAIATCLSHLLPTAVWFNLTVSAENGTVLNDLLMCNGSPTSGTIQSVNYVCATQNPNFSIYLITLQLSGLS